MNATKVDFLGPAYRRRFIALMLPVSVLNFADRAVFSALAQTIKSDMALSDLQLGLLQGLVFALLYAAVGLPIGRLAERVSRTRIISAAAAVWSLATAATGVAGSFAQLVVARLLVGMGEAGFTPASASMVGDVTPPHKRSSMMALIMLGSPIGAFAGSLLAGQIAHVYGWRWAFYVFGALGLIAAATLAALLPEPPRGLADDDASAATQAPPLAEFLRTLAANRTLLWVIAGGSIAGFGMTSISQFLAVFLARTHHLGVRAAATAFGSVSGLALTAGLLIGSFGTDYLIRRDPRWPAWGAAAGLSLAPIIYFFAFRAASLSTAIVLLVAAGASMLVFYGPTSGMIQNLLPARMRASGAALYLMLYTVLGSGLGPVFVGGLSDWAGATHYGPGYARDCPHGLPAPGAAPGIARACTEASAAGIQTALSLAVLVLFVAALCFVAAAPGLRRKDAVLRPSRPGTRFEG